MGKRDFHPFKIAFSIDGFPEMKIRQTRGRQTVSNRSPHRLKNDREMLQKPT